MCIRDRSTGVVRKIDELGRLVIPKELRRTLDLKDDIDYLEIYTEGSMITVSYTHLDNHHQSRGKTNDEVGTRSGVLHPVFAFITDKSSA